jgi:DNA-binding CsgD family transcriptional regulator
MIEFLFCNEAHAEIAGIDSAGQIIGKTDYDLFWRQNADHCRKGDMLTMAGGSWVNVIERLTRYDGTFDISISKYQLLDEDNNCIGVVGSYFDIKKCPPNNLQNQQTTKKAERVYLGEYFGNEYFTLREYEVFQHLLVGKSAKQIAKDMSISPKTIEYYIDRIKKKLQCNYKKDIIITAIKFGLATLNSC